MLNRRKLLCLLTLLCCALAVQSESSKKPTASRPNILYCLADDWAWPHAGVYGDKVVRVPNFERVAKTGFLFTQAFSAAPSCTPSRASMLTGRAPHSLEDGANLWGLLPTKFVTYPDILEKAGYAVGYTRKGWGPGNYQAGGRNRNPAGPQFKDFQEFLATVPPGKPFSFWFGSFEPHRPYDKDGGAKAGLKPDLVKVPAYWPDSPEVRKDILNYYSEVEQFDRDVGSLLELLRQRGELDNTLVVITGDNGWPFPRCKANLYNCGTHQPLAIQWPAKFKGGKTIDAFVNLYDLAPTFLDAAGIKPSSDMHGKSLLPLLAGKSARDRDAVFVERERHANVRKGDLSYPSRAVRTKEFLYIRNLRPDRWPAGDPEMWKVVGPFGDCDGGMTKDYILDHRDDPGMKKYFDWCFGKRPAEELYDLKHDPEELTNVADDPKFAKAKAKLRARLDQWMKQTDDPRATTDDDRFDHYKYFGYGKKKGGEK